MEKYKKKFLKRNKSNTYKFSIKSFLIYILFIIFIIIPNIYSVKFFKAYNLLSQELLLISNEGIILLNSESGDKTNILSFNDIITNENDLQFVSFNQPSYLDRNIICRVKEYIFIFSSLDYYLIKTLTLSHISNKEASVVPFKDKYENEYIFICYINDSKELNIEKYTATEDNIDVSIKDITKIIEYNDNTTEHSKNDGISCQLMNLSEYENNLLICFIQSESNYLNGLAFDPENNLSYLFLLTNKNINIEINIIKSAISSDETNCLICYEGNANSSIFQCIAFNIEYKIWSEHYQFIYYAFNENLFDFNVNYIDEKNEYFIYFPNSYLKYFIIQLTNDFLIKNSNDQGKCILEYQLEEFSLKYSFDFLYTNNKYIAIYSYKNTDNDNLITLSIDNFCNFQTILEGFNLVNQLPSSLSEASEIDINSSTIFSSNIFSTQINIISSTFEEFDSTLFELESSSSFSSLNSILSTSFSFQLNPALEEVDTKDKDEYFYNIKNLSCPENIPYENIFSHKCVEECEPEDFFNRKCKINNNSTMVQEKTIDYIKTNIIKGKFSSLFKKIIEEKEDLITKENNIIYQLTTTENQNIKEYYNISSIKLGECENKLKNYYNINQNDSLFILKIDYFIPELLIPIIEYEIYNPYTKEPLNLGICDKESINVSIPVSINENELYKYNPNSSFYIDKCFPYKTENGTDMTLYDRKKEFNNKNLSLCEKNCQFSQYKIETKNVICECEIKNKFDQLSFIENNKENIFKYFISFDKFTNFDIIQCFNSFFCKVGIKNNIGSYIILFIIFFDFVAIAIFYYKDFKEIKLIINQIVKLGKLNQFQNIYINKEINEISSKIKNRKKSNRRKKHKINTKKTPSNPIKNKKSRSIKNPINIFDGNNSIFNYNRENISKAFLSNDKRNSNSFKQQNINISIINNNSISITKNRKKEKNINEKLINLNDTELNTLSYEQALKYDRRTYFQYYLSLLKTKHLLIFTFYTSNDYNSRIIKICLFLFSFELLITVNSLFFQDETMHKIYQDNGVFDILYQLPHIVYSSLISIIITTVVKLLSLTEKNIIRIKKEASLGKSMENIQKMMNITIFKFITFFIINIILSILFWYYLGCFCAVFKNTQIYLLKDSFFSFILSMIYPFPINLIPGIFRISSLRDINRNKSNMYKISKFIQTI